MYLLTEIVLYCQIDLLHLPAVDLAEICFIVSNSLTRFVVERDYLVVTRLVCEIECEPCYQIHSGHSHERQHQSFYNFLYLSLEYLLANNIYEIIQANEKPAQKSTDSTNDDGTNKAVEAGSFLGVSEFDCL